MNVSAETWAFIFIILFILLVLVGIIHFIVSKIKGKSKPINSVTFFGTTSQLQSTEQKAAIEHVLVVQADKKMKEQESGEPDKKYEFLNCHRIFM